METATKLFADKKNCKLDLNSICDWSKPGKVAIEYHDVGITRRISYSDLNDARKKVENLLSSVIESYEFIGINSDVTRLCVPALMLGIQNQGSAFVNLSSIDKSKVCRKLGSTLLFSRCMDMDANLIHELDVHGETIKLLKLKKMSDAANDMKKNEFAYAITTSGTTGVPKIVKVPHASIVPNILDLRKLFLLSEADKIAQITAPTFDPSIVEIFLSLSSGGTLFVTSNEIINDPAEILKLIFQCKVTFLQTTPSLWQYRWNDDEIRKTIFGKNSLLRVLLLGGEPPPKSDDILALKHRENRTKIYNIYGVTEVSCWASMAEIHSTKREDSKDYGNLGKPLSETIFQVRNKHGDVICKGEGILHVGSDSRICIVDDENSASLIPPVFRNTGDLVTINDNGSLFYKGRCDRTVKRFGVRIDLIELESAVSKLNFVKNSLALWDDKAHKLYLCVSTSDPNKVEVKFLNELRMREELKKELRKLPAAYQPDRVKYFTDIQLTANGKICKKNLLKICRNGSEEIRLANSIGVKRMGSAGGIFLEIWQNHFSFASDDSGFLDHGGNSVKAIQMSNELSVALDSQFPELIGLLLKNETLSNCIDYVGKKVGSLQLASVNDVVAGTSNSSSEEFEFVTKRRKYHSIEFEKIREHNARVWQKCRGKLSDGKMQETDLPRSFDPSDRTFDLKLTVEYSRDLKKCVDASPTVFGYHSGDIYTSVGSHAGVILTEELHRPDSIKYEINFPDRIEASVLALNDFKGIVGCYDGHVYCVDLRTGEIIWKFKTGDTVKCTAVASDDEKSIFVGSYDKYLYNISIKDGREIWKLKGSEGSVSATPRVCSKFGSVIFGTLDGTCMSLKQNSGNIIWKTKFKDPVFSAPILLVNELYIVFCSVSGEVKCFESETGIENWRYKIDGNVFSHLVLRENSTAGTEDLIIGSMNKKVYCLSVPSIAAIPVLKYSITFECPIFATPYCEGEFLIVADTGGNLSLLNSFDGKILTSLKLNGNVFSSPVIIGEFIVVGCRDNNMYIVKITK